MYATLMDNWHKIVRFSKLSKHKEIVTFLKLEHGITHGFANMIALQFLEFDSHPTSDPSALLDAQYSGAKLEMRPVYEAPLAAVQKFGNDVVVSPKKQYVSLRRNKQFAIVQPSTNTRVDVGINLRNTQPTIRLEAAGSFNAMVSHRVRIGKISEVNKELIGWLKQAYEGS